jgi:hypothetical protein
MTGEIIGREDELSAIRAFLDRPIVRLRALVLEGEAGIGKSTIFGAAVAAARERSFGVLVSRPAEAERTLPYVVIGDLFGDTEPRLLDRLEVPRRRAFESALLRADADAPVDPRALGVAIHTLLPMLLESGPLVLAIDDDQWMDASSAATLGFALRRSLHQPVLLLLSRRIDGAPVRGLEERIEAAEVGRLQVRALSVGAIQRLLRTRLDIAFPRPTLMRLHEASGGNPFYALELTRARALDPSRELTAPIAVPPSLERLVAERLGLLDPPARQALLLVAAHGRMPLDLLQAFGIGDDVLDSTRTAHVIDIADDVVFFAHPLLASAIYQGVSREERRAGHQRLAAALEAPSGREAALVALRAGLEPLRADYPHPGNQLNGLSPAEAGTTMRTTATQPSTRSWPGRQPRRTRTNRSTSTSRRRRSS